MNGTARVRSFSKIEPTFWSEFRFSQTNSSLLAKRKKLPTTVSTDPIVSFTRENPFASGSAKYNRILSEVH